MSNFKSHKSVWDALEDDPIKAENMKLRSALMIAINKQIEIAGLTQAEAAKQLHISQPRVSALSQGKIDQFRLDTLVNIANRLSLHIDMRIAA